MSVIAIPDNERLQIEELEPDDEECPICLEVPSDAVAAANYGNRFKTLNTCGHKVCWTCIRGMLRTIHYGERELKCPLCRAVDTTMNDLVQEYSDNIARQGTVTRVDYERLLHLATARIMNRTRVINGPRVPIPQMVPVFCLRCEKPGCQSRNKTKRRCANHPQIPCCGKCKECSECSRT